MILGDVFGKDSRGHLITEIEFSSIGLNGKPHPAPVMPEPHNIL